MTTKTAELVQLCCLLVLIALFYSVLVPMGVIDPDGMSIDEGLPPSFSPRLLAIIAAIIIIARIIKLAFFSHTHAIASDPTPDSGADAVVFSSRVILGVVMALCYALILMPVFGFVPASLTLLCATLLILGERKTTRLVIFPCLVTLGVWLLFVQLLSVHLPVGILFDT